MFKNTDLRKLPSLYSSLSFCAVKEKIFYKILINFKKKLLKKLLFSILLYGDGRIDLIRDITIDDKLIYIFTYNTQNYPFCSKCFLTNE